MYTAPWRDSGWGGDSCERRSGARTAPRLADAAGHAVRATACGRWAHVGRPIPDCPCIGLLRELARDPDLDVRVEWNDWGAELPWEEGSAMTSELGKHDESDRSPKRAGVP